MNIQMVSWQTVIRDSVVGIAQGRICIRWSANKHIKKYRNPKKIQKLELTKAGYAFTSQPTNQKIQNNKMQIKQVQKFELPKTGYACTSQSIKTNKKIYIKENTVVKNTKTRAVMPKAGYASAGQLTNTSRECSKEKLQIGKSFPLQQVT